MNERCERIGHGSHLFNSPLGSHSFENRGKFGEEIINQDTRLVIPSIPMNLDLKNNDYLRGLDEREVRSLNGTPHRARESSFQ
jgi:hypothetical protein